MMHAILLINIGSTSTKVGFFSGKGTLIKKAISHSAKDLARLHGYDVWLRFHLTTVEKILQRHKKEFEKINLIVSRGGLTKPVEGGAYSINDAMLHDLCSGKYGWHPCNVGPAIAYEIAKRFEVKAIIYDSPVADEMEPLARFSGLKEIERKAAFHVLSQKSAARKAAKELGISYEQSNLIVAHLGGGITIGAHKGGKIIDGTHGLSEGPLTPQRTGALPLEDVLSLCYSRGFSEKELRRKLFSRGGVESYLGTHDIASVELRAGKGDEEAILVLKAMGYQICKAICSMAAVLEGHIDAVVLTGNLCLSKSLIGEIRNRVSFLGPLFIYPGEDELECLARGGLAVLRGEEDLREYT
ncbi:MAG: butyrate kinase [Deltaproteobacteria bacterium]|nr:butyrate kinase [Deltaproteobacteria bacterium]MBW2298826.1 butyrate kinase [Deltaproteobacteria bacterium]